MKKIEVEKLTLRKYSNLGSSIVIVSIHGIQVQNALVDLGASINIMKKKILFWLDIVGLRETSTILQLAHSSTIKLGGMIEYVIVTLNS